jgi:hypothetical protein
VSGSAGCSNRWRSCSWGGWHDGPTYTFVFSSTDPAKAQLVEIDVIQDASMKEEWIERAETWRRTESARLRRLRCRTN